MNPIVPSGLPGCSQLLADATDHDEAPFYKEIPSARDGKPFVVENIYMS